MAATNYPRKYWWLILIALPIIIALINIIPSMSKEGGSSAGNSISIEGSTVEGDVQIVGTQNILNEIKEGLDGEQFEELKSSVERAVNLTESGFYDDAIQAFKSIAKQTESPAVYNNLGALYLLENRDKEAREAFTQGIASNPDYKPLHANMAQLYQKEGNVTGAIEELEKASGEPNVSKRLKKLKEMVSGGLMESEPNNTIMEPNEAPVSNTIGGYLEGDKDVDLL